MNEARLLLLTGVISLAFSLSCRREGGGHRPAGPERPARAIVNGARITEDDVRVLAAPGHGNMPLPADAQKTALETVIRQELAAQRATELRLDPGPAFQDELRRRNADLEMFRRRGLAETYYQREIGPRAAVTDDEARKYYEANADRLRTELHVAQIMLRDEAAIQQAKKDLEAGVPFEDVARRPYARMPDMADKRPWDLGFLNWAQIPPPWRDVVWNLAEGQTSGIIRGPNRRFWIVKLIEKRPSPTASFDQIKPALIEFLKKAKAEELRQQIDQQLRANAKVSIVAPPSQ